MKTKLCLSVFLSSLLVMTGCFKQKSEPKQAQLNDGQIVDAMMTIDQLEIATSELVLEKDATPPVKALAQYIIEQHHDSYVELTDLADKLKLEPKPSELSEKLRSERKELVEKLMDLDGEAFDKAYVDAMVQSHEAGVKLIDETLLPQTKNPELKKFVEGFKAMVQNHLKRALGVQKSMG